MDNILKSYENITITHHQNMAVVTLAFRAQNADKIAQILAKHYGCALPEVNSSCYSDDKKFRFLRVGKDQLLCIFSYDGDYPISELHRSLTGIADSTTQNFCATDLSDGFRAFSATGSGVIEGLRLVTMLDIDSMAVDTATRTLMEHVGHYIIRNGDYDFLFLSPSSFHHKA